MATNSPDPSAPKPGGLQSMLARLRGMYQSAQPAEPARPEEEVQPTFDVPPMPPDAEPEVPAELEEAAPIEAIPLAEAVPAEAVSAARAEAIPVAPPRPCPICAEPRKDRRAWCDSCGYMFPPDPPPGATPVAADAVAVEAIPVAPTARLQNRYELEALVSEREGTARFRALDHGDGAGQPVPVTIVRMAKPIPVEPIQEAPLTEIVQGEADDEILPTFDDGPVVGGPITEPLPSTSQWPSLAWERNLLEIAQHPSLPAVLGYFDEGDYQYLVEELPTGKLLWDAWDDPHAGAEQRFGLLQQLADALFHLHQGAAILEGLRPDIVVVTPEGQARLTDLSDLLPLPVPADAPIRATLYTAPELAVNNGKVDARSDLYSFGAMIYALHVGRELTETDFDRNGIPKPFLPRFPDIHPLFGRLVTKTFAREVAQRFPTDEASKEDPTGFTELKRVLEVCGRTLDDVRLEISAWTTTGMVRTGNEDGFALLHGIEQRMDDLGESALVILCDGMGGYEAGEVAAAMAIQVLRKQLLQQKMFRTLVGASPFPPPTPPGAQPAPGGDDVPVPFDVETCKRLLKEALRETNRQVYAASRLPGGGRRTMGCTAEVVYLTNRHVVVGHVGDSRTYHLHDGRMIQLTRDQTLVNRLVELGTLTAEEAEHHPRKHELQQAIGGQPDCEPAVYHGELIAGDWVVVCSDGVSNHVPADDLQHMLQSEASSADMAARRLVNFVNIHGATDNATLVVVRAT